MNLAAHGAHRLGNAPQALLLVGSIGGLCAYLAWLLGGAPMAIGAAAAFVLLYFVTPPCCHGWCCGCSPAGPWPCTRRPRRHRSGLWY